MPEKHQSDCYRMINGKKYINFCDVLDEDHEAIVEACKLHKVPHRLVRHPDGFRRLFVREDKAWSLT